MTLFCHSHFSLKYGVLSPEELIKNVIDLSYDTIVLADINNTSAILEAQRIVQNKSLKIIPGIDFRNKNEQKFIAFAKSNLGYKEINDYLSHHLHTDKPFPDRAPAFTQAYVIYPFKSKRDFQLRENEYIGIEQSDLNKLIWKVNQMDTSKWLAYHQATTRNKRDFNTHRLLRAINQNTLLSKLEEKNQGLESHKYLDPNQLSDIYDRLPYLLKRTQKIVEECSVSFEFGKI